MTPLRAIILCAVLILPACAVARVPVKVAGTAVGATTKAAGDTILLVTRDAHPHP